MATSRVRKSAGGSGSSKGRYRVNNTSITKGTKTWGQIRECIHELTDGVVLSIDPSCGSTSSLPGWALYRAGKLVESGVIELTLTKELPFRLRELHKFMHQLIDEMLPDVLVYEELPPRHYGRGRGNFGGNDKGHASLLKSLGVIISIPGPTYYVGLQPLTWKRLVREGYEKGDESDAIEMGWIAIDQASKIQASLPKSFLNKSARGRAAKLQVGGGGKSSGSDTKTGRKRKAEDK